MDLRPPEVEHGAIHSTLLTAASDTVLRLTTLPSLMHAILREDGWRVLVRPKDGKRFENQKIADWVLGEPWAGLHFPNWETLYAILERNIEHGPACIELLRHAEAPDPAIIEREFAVKKGRSQKEQAEKNQQAGVNLSDNVTKVSDERGNAQSYTLRRLIRAGREDLLAEIGAGTLSANAAAIQAGFRKRMVSVPATDLTSAVRILCKHYDPSEIAIEAARQRQEWKAEH